MFVKKLSLFETDRQTDRQTFDKMTSRRTVKSEWEEDPETVAEVKAQGGADALRYVTVAVSDEVLMEEYYRLYGEDPQVEQEALKAAEAMRNVPLDDLDEYPTALARARIQNAGVIERRAPLNPFHSPIFGAKREDKGSKLKDPALTKNPLRGRLIVTISVNAALFMIFCQALIANRLMTGSFYTSRKENSNLGPSALTLTELGGLNANLIRRGEWIRFFWSMWMHSGWIHILLNIICQVQYFYMLEPDWGTLRTLLLFWFSGLTGNLFSVVLDPCKTTVGSSGGLFGLMGGVIPYCLEYWNSIPRPICILVFSVVTFVVTLVTGLSKSTDTWAHLGGLLGGLLFGFATISNAHVSEVQEVVKKRVNKNAVARWLKRRISPNCRCGQREWFIRIAGWGALAAIWITFLMFLLVNYRYQPPGSLTFSGITKCCCCYDNVELAPGVAVEESLKNWTCIDCEFQYLRAQTWGEYCAASGYPKK